MNSERVRWTIISPPLYGGLKTEVTSFLENKPDPWRSHGLECLNTEGFSAYTTKILLGINDNSEVCTSVWLSIPDLNLLNGFKAWTHLFHLFVYPTYRHKGLALKAVQNVVNETSKYAVSGISLGTDNKALKDRLYHKCGFEKIPTDPWLMLQTQNVTDRHKWVSDPYDKIIIRKASPHDLATAQSICAQKHWVLADHPAEENPCECEEDFCGIFRDSIQSYFIRFNFKEGIVVSWFTKQRSKKELRLLLNGVRIEDLPLIEDKITAIVRKIT